MYQCARTNGLNISEEGETHGRCGACTTGISVIPIDDDLESNGLRGEVGDSAAKRAVRSIQSTINISEVRSQK